jgi:O-succinylbenzoic acid--CoA ligase
VPLQLQTIISLPETTTLVKMGKNIIVGGAAIGKSLKNQIIEHQIPVFETYGMTETISHVALKNVLAGHDYFTTLDGVEIDVNTNNCLRICSQSTNDEWVQTNDVVEIIGKGLFILKGRVDNIINSGGIKIQIEEIERKLSDHFEWPFRYFCFGKPDEKLGQKLAVLVESSEKVVDINDVAPLFSKYEAPKEIYFLREFAETASGKVDKLKTISLLSAY